MITVDSLKNKNILDSKTKLVVADIDYTLVDFDKGHNAGINAIQKETSIEFGESVNNVFQIINEEHQQIEPEKWPKRNEFLELLDSIKLVQSSSIKKYGLKKWSRESWIIFTAQKFRYNVTKEEVENLRDIYWRAHAEEAGIYIDAQKFLDRINEKKINLILMTSGDSIMQINKDLSLEFDPKFSSNYKKEKRIDLLSLEYNALIIGDAVDKPSPEFFDIVFKKMQEIGHFNKDEVIFVGDSPSSDLRFPESKGYRGVFIKRKK